MHNNSEITSMQSSDVRRQVTDLILIVDHVSKSLIVNNADENVNLHLTAVCATIHPLCAVEVVADCNVIKTQ